MFFSSKFTLDDPHYFRALFADENTQVAASVSVPDIQRHTSSPSSVDMGTLRPSKLMLEKVSKKISLSFHFKLIYFSADALFGHCGNRYRSASSGEIGFVFRRDDVSRGAATTATTDENFRTNFAMSNATIGSNVGDSTVEAVAIEK